MQKAQPAHKSELMSRKADLCVKRHSLLLDFMDGVLMCELCLRRLRARTKMENL